MTLANIVEVAVLPANRRRCYSFLYEEGLISQLHGKRKAAQAH
jgi:hypothetical protein